MPELSVVIITYNEENNIGRCLESVKGLADEIIVLDSYSTDKTEEICRRYGARFFQHSFEGHIQQKNKAITYASYPHVLSLDADEMLSPELKKSILKVKRNWKHDGYYFNRLTNYCGKWIHHTSWYPARKLRLWDSRKGKWGGINPHDRFVMERNSSTRYLKGDLLHYSYYTIKEHINQINKFSGITAKAYFDQGVYPGYYKIMLNPAWRFIRDFFLRAGFLDGFYGFVICINSAHETFLKYVKLKQLIKENKEKQPGKICFFNMARTWGGGEKWHYDIATRLAKKGYNILMFTNSSSELQRRIKKHTIPTRFSRVSNLSFLNIFKILQIALILKKEKVSTIIVNLSADFKVAGLAAKYVGIKNIIYRRGSAIPIRNTLLNRYLFRNVATSIIVNSRETKRTIFCNNTELVPEEKVILIYNGLNMDLFSGSGKNNLCYQPADGEVVIGNAARFSEEKGHPFLFEMANRLKKTGINFSLLLAGIGKLEGKYQKQVENMGLLDKIKFLGFVEEIQHFNENIDIFVLTSEWEGFGYVLVEAMAAGKPVVAFDVRSSAEIVIHGETGYLVKKGNINELTERVKELILNKSLREKFGREGKKRVEEYFNIQKVITQVEELVRDTNTSN